MGEVVKLKTDLRVLAAALLLACTSLMSVGTTPSMAQGIFDGDAFDTTMIRAIRSGDNDVVEQQLFTDSANDRSNSGVPALIVAVESRNIGAVRLLADAGAHIDNRARRTDRTALTLAAELGEINIVRELLERGADVDKTGEGTEVALIKAARNGHAEILQILVDADAYLDETDLSGNSALELAERNRHRAAAQVLRDAGAY